MANEGAGGSARSPLQEFSTSPPSAGGGLQSNDPKNAACDGGLRPGNKMATNSNFNGSSRLHAEFLLEIQSVLMKLKERKVRQDFLAGKVIKVDDPIQALELFDDVFKAFHLTWEPNAVQRKGLLYTVTNHLEKLFNKSAECFIIPESTAAAGPHTYAVWMHALRKLIESNYWLVGQRREETFNGGFKDFGFETFGTGKPKRQPTVKFNQPKFRYKSTAQVQFDSTDDEEYIREKPTKFGSRRQKSDLSRRRIETVVLSDSSSDSSCDRSSSDSSFYDYRRTGRRSYPREVVQPEVFKLEGKVSLKQFLETFERYFKNKFNGSQWDCTQELGRFITGDLRDAYDALGGAQRKYRVMKQELLQWYKTQRIGRTHQWQAELKQLLMKDKESLKLYCMRLQEVAQRAYPHDDKECVKQMKKRLVKTVPSTFLDRMEKKEETKEMLQLGKRLTWGEIVDLAEKEDKRKRKARYYKDADSDDDAIQRLRNLCSTAQVTNTTEQTKESQETLRKLYTNSQLVGRPRDLGTSDAFVQCQWCGRPGHREANCWKKLGVCTLCGSSAHAIKDCSKYDPARNRGVSRTTSSLGAGPHYGKDCPNDQRATIILPSQLKDGAVPSTSKPLNY